MKILAVDTETTGLSQEKDHIVELGYVLWDTDRQVPVCLRSDILTGHAVSEETTRLTGITQADIDDHGIDPYPAMVAFAADAMTADAYLAHNVPFDRGFLESTANRLSVILPSRPWIDTVTDLPFYEDGPKKLGYVAMTQGFLNPFRHRAVFDALTAAMLLKPYDISVVMARAASPTVRIQALVSFATNDLAKKLGCHWEPATKQWVKELKEMDVPGFLARAVATGVQTRVLA